MRADLPLLAEMVHVRRELERRAKNSLLIPQWDLPTPRIDDLTGATDDELRPRHWDVVARLAGLGSAGALRDELIERTPEVVDRIQGALPAGFPSAVADMIFHGLRDSARRLHLPSPP